jgi:outer membrane lipase/esterase
MTRFITVSALLLIFTSSVSAAPITSFINFGDSLSDSGNLFQTTGGFPPPPYADGRFTSDFTDGSDGKVWYEVAADKLGFSAADSLNSLAGGNNHAWAGARTGPSSSFPPSLIDQANGYLFGVGGVADENALYSVFGGGNDVRDNDIVSSVSNISSIISQLNLAGAVNFFVPNVLDIGLIPESIAGNNPSGATAAEMTAASNAFNAELKTELQLLRTNLAINIIEFDLNALFSDVILNPADFGFTNVTEACFNGLSVCTDPDSYMFFDEIHPTAAGHALLGNLAFASIMDAMSVPTPATLALFLSGLAILGLRRKKA